MKKYQNECPHSLESVNSVKPSKLDSDNMSDTVKRILISGTEINELLAAFIQKGKEKGIVRSDIEPMMTVYILWSSITSLISLAQTKGQFLCKQFSMSEDDFLEYGFRQVINSILEVKIRYE